MKIPDGRRMLGRLTSHHYFLMTVSQQADIDMLGKVFDNQVAQLKNQEVKSWPRN